MKRNHLIAVCLLSLGLTSCGFLPKRAREINQAIWVPRWDYKTADDVRSIVRNCARAGFDTVLFQVRGNGTVAYRSRIEPWAEEFGFRDPGFDPLATAVARARAAVPAAGVATGCAGGAVGCASPTAQHQGQKCIRYRAGNRRDGFVAFGAF